MANKPYPIANFRPYTGTRNPYGQKIRDFSAESDFATVLADEDTEKFRGKWREYFGVGPDAFLNLELGAYHGETSIHLAKNAPETMHLAFEWKYKQCFKAGKKAKDAKLDNMTFLRANVARLPLVIAPGEVDRVWILFPDPWTKASHQKWRLLNPDFFQILARLLPEGKELLIKTDHADYAEYIANSIKVSGVFDVMPAAEGEKRWQMIPPTPFERIFLRQGMKINSFALTRNAKPAALPKELQEIFPVL